MQGVLNGFLITLTRSDRTALVWFEFEEVIETGRGSRVGGGDEGVVSGLVGLRGDIRLSAVWRTFVDSEGFPPPGQKNDANFQNLRELVLFSMLH